MTETYRLTHLGIELLEHVFQPPGLPLVDKGDGNGGTTSILVRGSAGSGKTTLAVALAHAIAMHHDGVVLHLTTEFSPAEVLFKADIIGVGRDQVRAWGSSTELETGPCSKTCHGTSHPWLGLRAFAAELDGFAPEAVGFCGESRRQNTSPRALRHVSVRGARHLGPRASPYSVQKDRYAPR